MCIIPVAFQQLLSLLSPQSRSYTRSLMQHTPQHCWGVTNKRRCHPEIDKNHIKIEDMTCLNGWKYLNITFQKNPMTTNGSKASYIEACAENQLKTYSYPITNKDSNTLYAENLVERHLDYYSEEIYSNIEGIWSSLPTQSLTPEIREKLHEVCEYLGYVCFIHDWLINEYDVEDDMKEVRDLDEDTRRAFREVMYREGNDNRRLADEIISTFPKSVMKTLMSILTWMLNMPV